MSTTISTAVIILLLSWKVCLTHQNVSPSGELFTRQGVFHKEYATKDDVKDMKEYDSKVKDYDEYEQARGKESLPSMEQQLAELRALTHELSNQQRSLDETLAQLQFMTSVSRWSTLHLAALSTCTQFHPPTTKTLYPFVKGSSCAEVCAANGSQFIKCLAVVRVFVTGEGPGGAPDTALGHAWARSGSCDSKGYSLGSELVMDQPTGHYTACCCGY